MSTTAAETNEKPKRELDVERDETPQHDALDPFSWRKYGEKHIKQHKFNEVAQQRSYYRCTYDGCPARKRVGVTCDGEVQTYYEGYHTCLAQSMEETKVGTPSASRERAAREVPLKKRMSAARAANDEKNPVPTKRSFEADVSNRTVVVPVSKRTKRPTKPKSRITAYMTRCCSEVAQEKHGNEKIRQDTDEREAATAMNEMRQGKVNVVKHSRNQPTAKNSKKKPKASDMMIARDYKLPDGRCVRLFAHVRSKSGNGGETKLQPVRLVQKTDINKKTDVDYSIRKEIANHKERAIQAALLAERAKNEALSMQVRLLQKEREYEALSNKVLQLKRISDEYAAQRKKK